MNPKIIDSANNSLPQNQQQTQPTLANKPDSMSESLRKVVTFKEEANDELISSSDKLNETVNSGISNRPDDVNNTHIVDNDKNLSMPNPHRAHWLLNNFEPNYKSKDNRRNSTIIDAKQFALARRRASLAIGSVGSTESTHAHLNSQTDRQRHFKQSTLESMHDNDCKGEIY